MYKHQQKPKRKNLKIDAGGNLWAGITYYTITRTFVKRGWSFPTIEDCIAFRNGIKLSSYSTIKRVTNGE